MPTQIISKRKTTKDKTSKSTKAQEQELRALILRQPKIVQRILYANFPDVNQTKDTALKQQGGRPTKLTKQAQELLERTVIKRNLPITHALNRLGISLENFYYYLNQAQQGRSSQYKSFLEKLQSYYESQIATQWSKAVESEDIRAIMFTLKVLDRNTFGDTNTKKESGKHLHLHLPPEEVTARLQRQGDCNRTFTKTRRL
jgi:hypothetical protein